MKNLLLATLAFCGFAGSAAADDVRAFNADMPGKAYSPFTVPEGYTQIESDFIHYTDDDSTHTLQYLDPDIKYGIAPNIEVDFNFDGLIDTWTKTGGRTIRQSGFGDITPRIKWNLIGNDQGWLAVAAMAGVKIPTASSGIGNGAFEYYAIFPAQISLPDNWAITAQEEVDVLKNDSDTGKHFSFSETAALSKSVTDNLTLAGELAAQSGTDQAFQPAYTADLGLSYAVGKSAILAAGVYLGLNTYAPRLEAYTGIAFRF